MSWAGPPTGIKLKSDFLPRHIVGDFLSRFGICIGVVVVTRVFEVFGGVHMSVKVLAHLVTDVEAFVVEVVQLVGVFGKMVKLSIGLVGIVDVFPFARADASFVDGLGEHGVSHF